MNLTIDSKLILPLLGGIIFLTIFLLGYSTIDNNWYEFRDDGVITMSVAKNLVDYGFIGVNPSGPIVEASSSPLQTFLYALIYYLTGANYEVYSWWQTVLSTFFIGFIFINFFAKKPITGVMVTVVSAASLTFFYPFFLWHASGMENALTHLLLLATIYFLYKALVSNQINYSVIIVAVLATIVRIENIYPILVLLMVFSIYWYVVTRNFSGFYLFLFVIFLWLVFHTWRFIYFKDLMPNTAYAQNISVGERIKLLVSLDWPYLQQSFYLAKEIFLDQAGWLLIVFFPMIVFAKKNTNSLLLFLLIILLCITSIFYPFLFGPTRIDHARTTTPMSLMVFLFLSTLYFFTTAKKLFHIYFLTGALPIILLVYSYMEIKPYYLGWSTKGFNQVRNQFNQIAAEHNIYRATVSNPDLGVMSWYKQFNVIDLGVLGSPIMAKLENGPEITEYYLNYGLPDIIEAHKVWIKIYCNSIFTQARFQELYQMVGHKYDIFAICKDQAKPPKIYWIRKDITNHSNSSERTLLNDLQTHLSVKRIAKEVNDCGYDTHSCRYIARTVYKFIPELRQQQIFDSVLTLFKSDTDRALLEGWRDPQAHQVIIQAVKKNLITPL
jgi:hypothetical protein